MKLLVFDIDGTITSNNKASNLSFKDSMKICFDISMYSDKWFTYRYNTDIGILREIVYDNQKRLLEWDEIEKFTDIYFSIFSSNILIDEYELKEVEGAVELINGIFSSKKYAVSIFTGGFSKIARKKLDILGIDKFIPVAFAEDGLERKDIFSTSICRAKCFYGTQFDEIVFFGDSFSDIKMSKELKIPLIGVTTNISSEEFFQHNAIDTIDDYCRLDIEEMLENVSSRFREKNYQ